ncbi:inorganic pyrophosphatase [Halobacteriovorax marinus]|uniref:Inorganic pyrophosphatase n=1 Tax=Halobacteriovorax marinus (strain ATCC BAA-682 / DSM 15412 / SJ) TaxID=862908 RepID=E1X1B6_HALMS|nr:inorganic diphosphatase [Halobacteriovorax marinus]ATH07868.1 inorganic pyrophosphatase [Halobacteriovorax marinus]CBW26507.1 putative inorganic pyrophosphatase [Halobacteriovorax marinus SJ]
MNPWHDVELGLEGSAIVNAIIEVPRGEKTKYELDKTTGLIKVDRILSSAVHYPANYGFIPRTYCDDKDPLDVLVLGQAKVVPMCLMKVKVIGNMHMIDGGEIDDKLIAVHADDPQFNGFNSIKDIPEHTLKEIKNFFETYKALEKKSVEVNEFTDKDHAIEVLNNAIELYNKEEKNLK